MDQATSKIEMRRDPSLVHYLRSLSAHQPLGAEELHVLAGRIRRGDRVALDRVVDAHLGIVAEMAQAVAATRRGGFLGMMDLIAEGNVALIEAARQIGEHAGRPFVELARERIARRMLDALSEEVFVEAVS